MLKSYVCFDLETTGLDPLYNEIIEIGALKVRDGKVAERFMEFIHPQEEISQMITNLTGITNEMVANARPANAVISDFLEFCEDDVLIGHNVGFDYSFMKSGASNLGLTFEKFGIDTFKIAQRTLKSLPSKSLSSLCEYYQIENKLRTAPTMMRLPQQNCIRHWHTISKMRILLFSSHSSLHTK